MYQTFVHLTANQVQLFLLIAVDLTVCSVKYFFFNSNGSVHLRQQASKS